MNTSGKPTVSVIVPMFNAGKCIERCAVSLVNQTLDDMEIVFVDDCSTDGTADELDRVLANMVLGGKKVKLIRNSTNLGCSESRNVGMANVTGEYIGFCDSDDWVEPEMFEEMLKKAISDNADIVGCGIVYESDGRSNNLKYCYGEEHISDLWHIHGVYSSLCNKLIRRSLYKDHDISSVKGISMWEDNAVSFRLRYFSRKTVIIDKSYYHYIDNPSSIIHGASEKLVSDQVACVGYLEKMMAGEFDACAALYDIFEYLKLESKRIYLENRYIRSARMWRRTFPETNSRGWRNKKFSKRVRVKMAVANYLPSGLADAMLRSVEWCTDRLRK